MDIVRLNEKKSLISLCKYTSPIFKINPLTPKPSSPGRTTSGDPQDLASISNLRQRRAPGQRPAAGHGGTQRGQPSGRLQGTAATRLDPLEGDPLKYLA